MWGFHQTIGETIAVAAMCLIAALLLRGRVHWGWIAGAIAFYFVHKFIVFQGFGLLPVNDLLPGRYNWEGKILATLATIAAGFVIFRGARAEWGFTLRQSGPAPIAGLTGAGLIAIAAAAYSSLYFPGVKSEPAADWLYQLTMPSFDEEFVYRGVLLLMLERAFKPSLKILGAPMGFGALIMILTFWFGHVLSVDADWSVSFAWLDIYSLIVGALLAWVRAATGSLVFPVVLHSWTNTAGYLL